MQMIRSPSNLDGTIEPAVGRLVRLRFNQLADCGENFVRFVLVQAGDTVADIRTALGMDIDLFECVLDHRAIYELPYVEGQDGSGIILLVPPGSDPELLSLCRAHAVEADCGDGD